MGNQYLDRKPAGADWLFKEFLTALTNRELRGVVEWQFEQMVCRACQDQCPGMCSRRRSAEHRLALARVELRRRAMFHMHVASRRR